MDRHLPPVGMRTVLPEINPLPRAQRHPAAPDRQAQIHRRQRGAHVRGHVVIPLRRVDEQPVAIRREPLEKRLKSRRTSGSAFS